MVRRARVNGTATVECRPQIKMLHTPSATSFSVIARSHATCVCVCIFLVASKFYFSLCSGRRFLLAKKPRLLMDAMQCCACRRTARRQSSRRNCFSEITTQPMQPARRIGSAPTSASGDAGHGREKFFVTLLTLRK